MTIKRESKVSRNCMVQGRDANRKLQRSIKAGKHRERMPSLVEQLRQVVTHWQMEHRQPFTYDGWDYKVSVAHAHGQSCTARQMELRQPFNHDGWDHKVSVWWLGLTVSGHSTLAAGLLFFLS